MKLNIGEDNILFLNIYMPTSGQDKDYKKVLDSIKEIIKMEGDDTMIIATGDLNTRLPKGTKSNTSYTVRKDTQITQMGHRDHTRLCDNI